MKIIPAIDIKGGQCVRLYQGQMDQETVYSDNPLEVAHRWADAGAEMLHIVDLDGAVEGAPVNSDIICQIISSVKIPVQVGGGIREIPTAGKYLDSGAGRVGRPGTRSRASAPSACPGCGPSLRRRTGRRSSEGMVA